MTDRTASGPRRVNVSPVVLTVGTFVVAAVLIAARRPDQIGGRPRRGQRSRLDRAGAHSALANALEAAGLSHEIIVVDDHSSDTTAATVRAVAVDHPMVRCIQN